MGRSSSHPKAMDRKREPDDDNIDVCELSFSKIPDILERCAAVEWQGMDIGPSVSTIIGRWT